jgi:hypothetical protein
MNYQWPHVQMSWLPQIMSLWVCSIILHNVSYHSRARLTQGRSGSAVDACGQIVRVGVLVGR